MKKAETLSNRKPSKKLEQMIEDAGEDQNDFAVINLAVKYIHLKEFVEHLAKINVNVVLPQEMKATISFFENREGTSH